MTTLKPSVSCEQIMSHQNNTHRIALWAVTPKGAELAQVVASAMPQADIFLPSRLKESHTATDFFHALTESVKDRFNSFSGHIFIMATGIVVRSIAPMIRHKTVDPAVVVVDELGQYAISLLSGHIGGANDLAKEIATIINAQPIITTATDLHQLPAIDTLAKNAGLVIENPDAIKHVHMAILGSEKIYCHDPYNILRPKIPNCHVLNADTQKFIPRDHAQKTLPVGIPGIYIDDAVVDFPDNILILRPKLLAAGMGCNRNTPLEELEELLINILKEHNLSQNSLACLATIDIKNDETGLLALSSKLNLPIRFFSKEALNQVKTIRTPSVTVEKHVGVKSVCEAAAILATEQGNLIIPKRSTPNVTVAIARKSYMS